MLILPKTRLRNRLFSYAFTHAEGHFYVREVAKKIDEDPGNLSRELRRLEKEGLFTSHTVGRTRLYALNNKYPLYQELKDLFYKTSAPESQIKQFLAPCPGIKLAFLQDEGLPEGAIRVTVVGIIDLKEQLARSESLSRKLNRRVSVIFYPLDEFRRLKEDNASILDLALKKPVKLLIINI